MPPGFEPHPSGPGARDQKSAGVGRRLSVGCSAATLAIVGIARTATAADAARGHQRKTVQPELRSVGRRNDARPSTGTDIATGWTECAPLPFREQTLVRAVLGGLRELLPFDLLGFDTDNDSVFMNETVRDYCRDGGIVFTRCRPWRKNGQAFVEQKNGAVVRHMVGYRRLEGPQAVAALARLYAATRLFVNFFPPSFKLAGKTRDGARVHKRYHAPATPFQRLLADPRTSQDVRDAVKAQFETLDPILLLRDTRLAQHCLVDLADKVGAAPEDAPSIDDFLAGLRTAWKEGEVRPTAKPAEMPKRGRRRPDPLADVTDRLRDWFEEEP